MLNNNDKVKESIVKLPCPGCGGQLTYSAEKQLIACGHCGFSKDFDKSNHLVTEQSLAMAEQSKVKYVPKDSGKKVIDCAGCGSKLMIDETEVSVRCNFCGSERVNEKAFDQNLIQPQGILPFKIPKKEAINKFKDWIKKGWFHPNKLKKLAALGDIHGIYVPFWTYDSQTYTEWNGEAGYYYYETEQVYENGKYVSKQVRKVRWEWRSGSFYQYFDDVLIVASKGLPERTIEKIFPYRLEEVINHNAELMVGWEAEIYSLDVKEGYPKAEEKMMTEIRSRASRDLGGDTQRGLNTDSDFYDQTFKHVILPVWLCTYRYNDKSYQFAVNGQTGKINGDKPLSVIKIVLFILVILVIIGLIVYFVNKNNG
jgi:DNA-directed RNA polymerase subunit RPC12/RpoP